MDCVRYYEQLAAEFHLNLDTQPVFSHEMTHPAKCEAHVAWNGKELSVMGQSANKLVHKEVLQNLKELLARVRAPRVRGHIYTGDNSMCHSLTDRLIEHSRSPFINDTILLPIHSNQMRYVREFVPPKPRTLRQKTCAWFGGNSGHAVLQSAFNKNRTRCDKAQTDRQCIVAMNLSNVRFGKHAKYHEFDCILAIDGNGYSGSFKTSLENGQLAVRVGGFSHNTRWSSYEWFEPFLRPNYHFIQTSVDNLRQTLEDIKAMPLGDARTIAANGQRAFSALVNETSIMCYVHNILQKRNGGLH